MSPDQRLTWLDVAIPVVIASIAVCFRSYYLLDLRWAWVGDENSFREYAAMLAKDKFMHNPLGAGVYEGNSILSSQFQALFLLFPGNSEFLWRLSSLATLIPWIGKWIGMDRKIN